MEESGEAELEVSCCRLVLRLDGRSTSELELAAGGGGRRPPSPARIREEEQ